MEALEKLSDRTASRVQEAIDLIVQVFDYPEQVTIQYTSEDSQKRTTIEIEDSDTEAYELRFHGAEPDENPVLTRIDR